MLDNMEEWSSFDIEMMAIQMNMVSIKKKREKMQMQRY
jgi:hypothetical protein